METDERMFIVRDHTADDPDSDWYGTVFLEEIKERYPSLYPFVQDPEFHEIDLVMGLNHIGIRLRY